MQPQALMGCRTLLFSPPFLKVRKVGQKTRESNSSGGRRLFVVDDDGSYRHLLGAHW